MDGQTNKAQTNLPFNFFEFGSITVHKCTRYGPDELNLRPFYHLTLKCDLDLQPTWTNVSNGTFPSRRQQLCKIILKSMHKCSSYGQDKLHLWLFWPLFDPYDLDLQPTWKKMFQTALFLLVDNNCEKLFWNQCINVQVMARTSSIYDHFDPCGLDLQPTWKKYFKWHFSSPNKNCNNFVSLTRKRAWQKWYLFLTVVLVYVLRFEWNIVYTRLVQIALDYQTILSDYRTIWLSPRQDNIGYHYLW